jgi:hypothetical protein
VTQRIGEVLAIVAAIPTSVLPDHVDHSADDLLARISQAMARFHALDPERKMQLITMFMRVRDTRSGR